MLCQCHTQENETQGLDPRFLRALVLAYCASQNRSLTAARCVLETVLELYRLGYTAHDVEVALSIAGTE